MIVQDNFEGLIMALNRNERLALGQEFNNTYVTGATAQVAPTGTAWYRIHAIGENATIAAALDLNGNSVSGLVGAVIPNGQDLYVMLSSITFSAPSANCSVQLWKRWSAD